jgi:tetratricopeptide (TPR) repeat protein
MDYIKHYIFPTLQAINCLQNQLRIARELGARVAEGEAVCGLGGVYQQMGEYEQALEYHQLDLELAISSGDLSCQCKYACTAGACALRTFNKYNTKLYEHITHVLYVH